MSISGQHTTELRVGNMVVGDNSRLGNKRGNFEVPSLRQLSLVQKGASTPCEFF